MKTALAMVVGAMLVAGCGGSDSANSETAGCALSFVFVVVARDCAPGCDPVADLDGRTACACQIPCGVH